MEELFKIIPAEEVIKILVHHIKGLNLDLHTIINANKEVNNENRKLIKANQELRAELKSKYNVES